MFVVPEKNVNQHFNMHKVYIKTYVKVITPQKKLDSLLKPVILLVEVTRGRIPGENHRPVTSH